MIPGRNARVPVIGDTVLFRTAYHNGAGVVDTALVGYEAYRRDGRGAAWQAGYETAITPSRLRAVMAMTIRIARNAW